MARRLYAATLLGIALLVASAALAVAPAPSSTELRASIEALTAPELAGRRSGTEGGDRAAALTYPQAALTHGRSTEQGLSVSTCAGKRWLIT